MVGRATEVAASRECCRELRKSGQRDGGDDQQREHPADADEHDGPDRQAGPRGHTERCLRHRRAERRPASRTVREPPPGPVGRAGTARRPRGERRRRGSARADRAGRGRPDGREEPVVVGRPAGRVAAGAPNRASSGISFPVVGDGQGIGSAVAGLEPEATWRQASPSGVMTPLTGRRQGVVGSTPADLEEPVARGRRGFSAAVARYRRSVPALGRRRSRASRRSRARPGRWPARRRAPERPPEVAAGASAIAARRGSRTGRGARSRSGGYGCWERSEAARPGGALRG